MAKTEVEGAGLCTCAGASHQYLVHNIHMYLYTSVHDVVLHLIMFQNPVKLWVLDGDEDDGCVVLIGALLDSLCAHRLKESRGPSLSLIPNSRPRAKLPCVRLYTPHQG